MTNKYEAAVLYTSRGWVIHPLYRHDAKVNSPGKQPILEGWQNRTKATDKQLKEWFIDNDYNIGLVCGKESGVVVIDYDHELFWGNITKDLGSLTLQARRTDGRGHVFFKYNPDIKSQKHHLLGIEILSDGSNVVLAPSIHKSGDVYTWVNPDIPVVEVLPILLERLTLLFKVEQDLVQQMSDVRPCFKTLWNSGKPGALHGADGREAMLAWATELKAKDAGIDEILMLSRLVYKNDFDSGATIGEWKKIKGKPWRCVKIKERLSGIISCSDCPIENKQRGGGGGQQDIKPVDIANQILSANRFVTFIETGELFYYNDGTYHKHAEVEVKKMAERIKPDITTHWNNEIIDKLKVRSYKGLKELDKFKNYIHLNNGLLNIKTMELEPHNPDKIVLVHISIDYDPDALCPNIDQFFKDVLDLPDIPAVEEFFGYCLLRDYSIQKQFMLVGDGSNGKSTLLTLLSMLLGSENVVSLSIQEIAENRFATANLFNKLANIYADISRTALAETGRIKILTGGDVITAERKFGGYFSFINYAKMIFSANRVPLSYDESDAFFRRWVIINFPNTFNEQQGKGLIERITTPGELSGLLNVAIKGLKRLLETRRFSNQKSTEQIKEQYIRMSDSIQAFAWDCIEISPDKFMPKKEVYHQYTGYCRKENIPIASEKTFFMRFPIITRIEEFYPTIDKKRVRSYKGVCLKLNILGVAELENSVNIENKDINSSKPIVHYVQDVHDSLYRGLRHKESSIDDYSINAGTEERGNMNILHMLNVLQSYLKTNCDERYRSKPTEQELYFEMIDSLKGMLGVEFEDASEDMINESIEKYLKYRGWI